MNSVERTTELRRKIDLYREYLAGGVEGERATIYLRELQRLQAELDSLESDKRE